ncbi:MAG TPA: xanthine dehydrogenase family protein molybdopterin-binding subunit [Streptosporangiaceae bacterium]|nr:xanthine dehydrogenase family protein molybdopterin-binding subunit [Streptosporangiaceae bacterium]
MSILGTRVVRTEDPRLLTVGGTYVDDLRVPELENAAQVTFVRSPLAHARITGIDTSEARDEPGVVAVLTSRDLGEAAEAPEHAEAAEPEHVASDEELASSGEGGPGAIGGPFTEPTLAGDRVRFVGDAVAMVLTDGRYQGEDVAELVSVDYEPLPAVVGTEAALAGDTLLFPPAGTNVAATGGADAFDDSIFEGCEAVVEQTIVNQRVAPVPLEGRAAAAVWRDGKLTVWTSTQNAQIARATLADALKLEPAAIRVIAPDVGGGFGAKIGIDREVVAVARAAMRTGRPTRWVETRTENLVAMTHGRDQVQHIKIGGTRDGRVLAYRLGIDQDTGAYPRLGGFLPTLTSLMAVGAYDIPRAETAYRVLVTNTTPIAAYRGAGRPEATAAIERAIDLFAAEIGMDPAEVRRRNLVPPDKFPFKTASGAEYDTGRYAEALDTVLEAAGYADLRTEQARRRESNDPVQLGIGLSTYVEITAADATAGETARLAVHDDGSATVYTGSSAHGQGHRTAWAMLVQSELGIPMEQVTVVHGDTDLIPEGIGTYGSRSLQIGGSAVHKAAIEVKEEARRLAAEMLEASEDDLVLDTDSGQWQVRGDPAARLSWGQVAGHAGGDGLVASVEFKGDHATFPFGAHLAVVEVDTETGKVRYVRHVTVDDAGPVLNPVLAEGQRHGGIAQGAAQALLEEVRYDADGNPVTSNLADYAAITATELPSFELVTMETPTTLNPLGVKGIGEAGTIGATPAAQNAVVDAVAHLGIRHIDMPTTPERVWTAIMEAQKARGQ